MARGANSAGGYVAPLTIPESNLRRLADILSDNAYNSPITTGGWGGLAQLGGNLAQVGVAKYNADRADKERTRYVSDLTSKFGQNVPQQYQPLVEALANTGDYGGLYQIATDAEERKRRDDSRARVAAMFDGGINSQQPQTQPAESAPPGTIEAQELPPISGYRSKLASLESGGDPNAKNPNSSATGTYQFMPDTWAGLGMDPAKISDPQQQEIALGKFNDQNNATMRSWLGRDANDAEIYAAHRFGAEGAQRLYTSRPDASIESIIGPEAARVNPDIAGKSAGQVRSMFEQRMGSQATWRPQQQPQQPQAGSIDAIADALTGGGGQDALAAGGGPQPGQYPTGPASTGPAPQDWQSIVQNLNPIERAVIESSADPEGELLKIVQGKMDAQSKESREFQTRGASVVNLLLPDGKTVRAFDSNRQQDTISRLLQAGAREVGNDYQPGDQGGPFPGTSVQGQSLNIIHNYQLKQQRGEATTPDEDSAYHLALANSSQLYTDPITGAQYVFSPITRNAVRLDENGQPMGESFGVKDPAAELGNPSGTFDDSSTVLEAAGEGTGFTAGLARWYQGTIGQIPGTPQADETVAASNAIRLVNQTLKESLVNNPRFPVSEQEIVSRMLPDPESLLTNPGDQQNKLRQLHEYIRAKMGQNQRTLSMRFISADERRRLMDQNASMESAINMLQSLPVIGQAGGASQPTRLKYGEDGVRVR